MTKRRPVRWTQRAHDIAGWFLFLAGVVAVSILAWMVWPTTPPR